MPITRTCSRPIVRSPRKDAYFNKVNVSSKWGVKETRKGEFLNQINTVN